MSDEHTVTRETYDNMVNHPHNGLRFVATDNGVEIQNADSVIATIRVEGGSPGHYLLIAGAGIEVAGRVE